MLELETTDDMIEELLSRCNHGVITLSFNREDDEEKTIDYLERRWIGGDLKCSGLCSDINMHIIGRYNSDTRDPE